LDARTIHYGGELVMERLKKHFNDRGRHFTFLSVVVAVAAFWIAPASAQVVAIQENTVGFCGVEGTVDSNNSGFTGSGFANTDNAIGRGVSWKVNVPASGVYQLEWRFANGTGDRPGSVKINGAAVTTVGFPSTGVWTTWTTASTTVSLNAGPNSIRLEATNSGGLANIDSLTVTGGSAVQAADCNNTNACGDVTGNNLLSSCSGNPAVCLLGGGVGNYRVAMKFDPAYNGELEVFAESRRRMFASPQQGSSTARCASLLVNVRDPEGEPYQSDHGTAGLNLRITKGTGAVTFLTISPASSPRTLFIAGDSTVSDQLPQLNVAPAARYTGWGQFIPAYFDDEIAVSNYADSGEGTAAFRTDGGGLWNMINARLKSGDWVMIQLGHNDKTTPASLYRSRITNLVNVIRSKGASPILITPMIRNTGDPLSAQHVWGDLNIRNELIGIANARAVPLIDLMKLSSDWAASIGQSAAQAYFVGSDRTHSNESGAKLFAEMIVNDLRRQNIGIDDYLRQP
jgi:lysophospholipase L1-like esterase